LDSLVLNMSNYFNASLHFMLVASLHATYPHCYPGGG
tara:strand:+ start:2795 stop:2905 length:111 start_codon:yes stop_codon:yes gene_type:complete